MSVLSCPSPVSVPIYTFSQFGSILFLLGFGLDHDLSMLSTGIVATAATATAPETRSLLRTPLRTTTTANGVPTQPTPTAGGGGSGGASLRALTRRALVHVFFHALVVTAVVAGSLLTACAQ